MDATLQPATSLEDIYKALSPRPLEPGQELRDFYVSALNDVRGGDKVARILLNLRRYFKSGYYRAFLMGHQGVGKSTELSRLITEARPQFRAIRFNATTDLNPADFKPFDVLLVMILQLLEEVNQHTGEMPPDALLHDVKRWFARKTYSLVEKSEAGIELGAEAGLKAPSLLAQILTLGGTLRSSLKYAANRERKTEEEEFASIPQLIGFVNKLLDECNAILQRQHNQEWLFIGEDFDKLGSASAQTEDLFLRFGNIFHELHTHLIFTIPVTLVYSDRATQLAFGGDRVHNILDTPVFLPDYTPHEPGRKAIEAVLCKRMSPDLFDAGQMTRLLVASGGNLRDLFKLVADAADTAILRHAASGRIEAADTESAINALRSEYLQRLGEGEFDEQQASPITRAQKTERLLEVYGSADKPTVPDAVLYSLLRARAVQEFNGSGWYGVHPLVVDILQRQGHPLTQVHGEVLGGTD